MITPKLHAGFLLLFALGHSACSSTGVRDVHAHEERSEAAVSTTARASIPGDLVTPSYVLSSEPSAVLDTALPDVHAHAPVLTARPAKAERPWTGPVIPLDQLAVVPYAETPEEEDRWSSFLPFYGDAARERGYELPYPFGVGANVLYITRPTNVKNVRAGVNGNPLNDINFLDFDASADVSTIVGRFDTWILPLLNIYLMGGYIWNESTVSVLADLPGAPGTPVTFPGELEGPMFGGGATMAGGYKKFFSTLDVNFSRSQLGALSDFEALLGTVRLGYNTSAQGTDLRFWTGATYWDTARTIEGTIPLSGVPGISTVSFAVDQEPEDPWTVLLGTSVTVSKSFWLLLELQGWDETRALTAGAAFRF